MSWPATFLIFTATAFLIFTAATPSSLRRVRPRTSCVAAAASRRESAARPRRVSLYWWPAAFVRRVDVGNVRGSAPRSIAALRAHHSSTRSI